MIAGKFLPPRTNHILERNRLQDRLLSWEDKKLVIIHGPAGQGKSTLAAGYVRSVPPPVVWYNMDREDDDIRLFLTCLAQAVQQAVPSLLARLPLIRHGTVTAANLARMVREWADHVFTPLSRPCLVVFDDLNAAPNAPEIMSAIQTLLEVTPPHVRFLLLSRTRPELQHAGLRAKRLVGEICGHDLKFTDAEAYELFNSVFGMQLTEHLASRANRTSEGWPAGLVLMHEYLSAFEEDSLPAAIDGPPLQKFRSHIFDFLAQEVFRHLPANLQAFLLRTSVADQLPIALIEQLSGVTRPGAAALLAELHRRNLFVNALDDQGMLIRYHSLFREFLQKTLKAGTRPGEVRRLYTRAARFFQKEGDPVRAVELLLASSQFPAALRVIESCAPALIARGQMRTMLRWQASFTGRESGRPWFLLAQAVSLRYQEPRPALALFERSLKGFRNSAPASKTTGEMLSLCGIIEQCFHSGGDFRRMERIAAQAIRLLEQHRRKSGTAQARLLLAVGMAWFFTGKLERSRDALLLASDLFRRQGDPFSRITCAIYLTPCALYQGDFRLAREALAEGFAAQESIPGELGGRAALFLTQAMTSLFEGNFAEARECIDQCRNLAQSHLLQSIGFLSLDIQGWLKIAQGDLTGAEQLLRDGKGKGQRSKNHFFIASAAHLLAITHLFQGRLQKAKRESDCALGIPSQSHSRLFHAIYLIASGAILLKLSKVQQAEQELLAALTMLRKVKAVQQEANAHLMLALLYLQQGVHRKMRKHLQDGFSIGRERGFTYYALLKPEELTELARVAADQDICPDYCRGILEGGSAGMNQPQITVHCMGTFRVFRGEILIRESQWKGKTGKNLLKLLVAHEGQRLQRDRAIEMLWPEKSSDNLRALFNSMIYRVRKALGAEPVPGKDIFCLHEQGEIITLDRSCVWTDVRQFLAHAELAARLKRTGHPKELLREYERAIRLYQGDFLPDDLYTDWTTEARDRLRLEYLRVLEEAAVLAEELGEKEKAGQFQDRLFLADSCNEKACRWLMTRHVSEGQRSDAIRVYERCERALKLDMDVEPEAKTKRLYRGIIGG